VQVDFDPAQVGSKVYSLVSWRRIGEPSVGGETMDKHRKPPRSRPNAQGIGRAIAPFLAALIASLLSVSARSAPPGPWSTGPFDALLRRVGREQVLYLELSSSWCEPCNQLAMEVLDTPAASEFIGADVGLRVDFDSDEGQDLKRRYGVMSIPTLLVIHREGFEIGRVEGYSSRREWLDSVYEARTGRVGLEVLAQRKKQAPRDPQAELDLAQAQIVRRDIDSAMPVIDRLLGHPDLIVAARAARIKGRWLLRVREDGQAGLEHFAAMVERFRETPHEGHFVYWKAEAFEALKRPSDAVAVFVDWRARRGDTVEQAEAQAGFMVHHGYDLDASLALIEGCLLRRPTAQAWYLKSRLLSRRADPEGALAAAREAVRLEPDNALFQNALAGASRR
jgi:tetratricopeptide (TPR) repeat protein